MHARSLGAGLFAALLLAALAPPAALAEPRYPYPWPDHSVIPVFFVPRDWSVESDEVVREARLLDDAMEEVRDFYAENVGGRTFRLNDLEVVQAEGPKEHYHIIWNGGNIYEDGVEFDGNMEHEVVDELHRRGYPTPVTQDQSGYSVMIFVKGAGGWAGAREFPNADGGWAILGDFTIDSLDGTVAEDDYWWSGARKQKGAIAHELGHTFDLPHPDAYGRSFDSTVMGSFWGYPRIGMNGWDRQHIAEAKRPFFATRHDIPTTRVRERTDRVRLQQGSLRSGDAGSLAANDDDRLVIASRSSDPAGVRWYGRSFRVSDELTGFTVEVRSSASRTVRQTIEVWNGRTQRWQRLAAHRIGTSEETVRVTARGIWPSDHVVGTSETGEMRVRIRVTSDRPFVHRTDVLRLSVTLPD